MKRAALLWTQYDYAANVFNVVDGDTVDVVVGFGLYGLTSRVRVRLAGIDAAESHDEDGPDATAHLKTLLGDRRIRLRTLADQFDSFGRVLGYLWPADAREGDPSLNARMLRDGFATPYSG